MRTMVLTALSLLLTGPLRAEAQAMGEAQDAAWTSRSAAPGAAFEGSLSRRPDQKDSAVLAAGSAGDARPAAALEKFRPDASAKGLAGPGLEKERKVSAPFEKDFEYLALGVTAELGFIAAGAVVGFILGGPVGAVVGGVLGFFVVPGILGITYALGVWK